jgi:hypothetical protein
MTIGMRLISQRLKTSLVGSLRIHLKREWSKRLSGISTTKNGAMISVQVITKEKGWVGRE